MSGMVSEATRSLPRTGLCACGCGQATRIATQTDSRAGVQKGDPMTYLTGHVFRRGPDDYVVDAEGCWMWQRSLNPKGYGSKYCARTGGCRAAHRVYYESVHGAVADDVHLHHLCGKPGCVNPAHLEPVSPGEHGGQREVRAIRTLAAAGVDREVIADAFGLTLDRVGLVVNSGGAL